MIESVGPSSGEGSLLEGTSDEPSSGPLPLTLEQRLKILQKWQKRQTLYTEETREFILKSGFSRDQPEKVSSVSPSSTEGSLLKETSDDPSSGPLPFTLEKRLEILQKWQKRQTLYTEETREFILKSGFSRDQPEKVSSIGPSSTEDIDSALVQQQEQASSQSACQPVVTSLSDQTPFSSFDVYLSKDQWCRCDVCDRCILSKNKQSHLESTLHLTNVAAMKDDSDDVDLIKSKRSPDDKASVEITKVGTVPADTILSYSDDVDFIKSKRIPDDKASDAGEITKVGTVPADTILSYSDCVGLIKSKRSPDDKASDAVEITKLGTFPADTILSESDYVDFIESKRIPDDKASDAVEITKVGTVPADTILSDSDYVDFIESKRIPDDKASDAVEITKFETVSADTILRQMLIQARRFTEEYGLRFLYESDFTELENVNRHVFQISHRNKVLGTAFFFNPFPEGQQYLLTAGHVIAGYDEDTVLKTDGWLCFPASPVGISSIKDVGVLRIEMPLLSRMYSFLRPLSVDLGTETSTHIYVVGCMSGALSEKCPVLPSQDKDDGFIRFQSKLFSEDSFGSPCLVFKDGQYVVKGMLIGREGGTDTPYELIAITFRCVLKRLGFP